MEQFITIRNFEKFQHYHDRKPPWIKLYRDILSDDRLFELTEAERWQLIGLFILASQNDNLIPYKPAWLKKELALSKPISLQKLIDTGWVILLEQDASKMLAASNALAEGYQVASKMLESRAPARYVSVSSFLSEKKKEGEGIGESEGAVVQPASNTLALGEFKRVILTPEQHAKLLAVLNGNLETYVARFDRWVNEAPKAKANGVRREDRHAYESIMNWYERDVKDGKVTVCGLPSMGSLEERAAAVRKDNEAKGIRYK